MIWPLIPSLYFTPGDGSAGGTATQKGAESTEAENDDAGGEDQSDDFSDEALAYFTKKGIDPAKASTQQIAAAYLADRRALKKQLESEVKGRQSERSKRQALETKMQSGNIEALLADPETSPRVKEEINALAGFGAKAREFQESVELLADAGVFDRELLDVLQAGPAATRAVLKTYQRNGQTGAKQGDPEDAMADRIYNKILLKANLGTDLHQTAGSNGKDGGSKSYAAKYDPKPAEAQSFVNRMKAAGAGKK